VQLRVCVLDVIEVIVTLVDTGGFRHIFVVQIGDSAVGLSIWQGRQLTELTPDISLDALMVRPNQKKPWPFVVLDQMIDRRATDQSAGSWLVWDFEVELRDA